MCLSLKFRSFTKIHLGLPPLPTAVIYSGTWWMISILIWAFLQLCRVSFQELLCYFLPHHLLWKFYYMYIYIYFNVLKKIPCLSSFSFPLIELPTFFLRILGRFLPAHVGMPQFCFGQCQICYFLPLLSFISLEVVCFSSKNSFLFNMALFLGNQLLSY